MIRTDNIKRALIRYLPLTPAIFLAVLIPRYWVDLPQYDEWDSVTFFEHLSQGSLTASLLFKQANEYRQFFPNVIVVALGWLTLWDIRYDLVLIFIAAVHRIAKKSAAGGLVERRMDCRTLPVPGSLSSRLSEAVVDSEPADCALSSFAGADLFSRLRRWPIRT